MGKIKLGTCVKEEDIVTVLPDVIKSGFESIELYYAGGLKGINLVGLSEKANNQIEGTEICVRDEYED